MTFRIIFFFKLSRSQWNNGFSVVGRKLPLTVKHSRRVVVLVCWLPLLKKCLALVATLSSVSIFKSVSLSFPGFSTDQSYWHPSFVIDSPWILPVVYTLSLWLSRTLPCKFLFLCSASFPFLFPARLCCIMQHGTHDASWIIVFYKIQIIVIGGISLSILNNNPSASC